MRRRLLVIVGLLAGILILGGVLLLSLRGGRLPSCNRPGDAHLTEARSAISQQRYDVALSMVERAESEGAELPPEILFDCAQASMQLGKVAAAERYLRRLLAKEPDHTGGNVLLCAILRVAGRHWELRPHALVLMRQGNFNPANLVALTSATHELALKRGPHHETMLEDFILENAKRRAEITARLSQAHADLRDNKPDEAQRLLEKIIQDDPEQWEAQALLGSVLLGSNRIEDFQRWQAKLPADSWQHPDIWMVAGEWAERKGDRRMAARCYWEVLKRHPDHMAATYRLSQMLVSLHRSGDAELFTERARQLAEVQSAAATPGWYEPNIRALCERLESLGRLWESAGWSVAIVESDSGTEIGWALERIQRLRSKLGSHSPLVLDAADPAKKIDLSDYPTPDWQRAESDIPDSAPAPAVASRLAFVDSASTAGIQFSYFNGADPRRAYMFEFSGGGVAVLDCDLDGWPDLHLTQGCKWPVSSTQQEYVDRLYRNLGNGQFEDITEKAGLFANGYGQGVAAGDIDNDGWPDLYIANIGRNQLYHNNGDGTFTDITSQAGIDGAVWTLSTLIADLNGDTCPDLFDVNYLGGPDVFKDVCLRQGKPIQCFPGEFPAEMDKVYQGSGDGQFRDVSQEAGILVPDGIGMGIVAADFDGTRRLSLFITNDTTANFFFHNQTPEPGSDIRFVERALTSGLAYSVSGMTASHMGIAAGDANGDELLDLFVTNFQGEANNYYVQEAGLFFDDRIRQSKLHDPGFAYEGWGTQFLDADLDGNPDLVVANGHLDNYPHTTGLTVMPTQLFRNTGNGEFTELPARELGSYFQKRYLGRAIATLDWNRDGKPDFCVTHTDAPFALLTNQTQTPGHFLVVHLRGVMSARDAIGTKVRLRAGERKFFQQLTAGDGYTATNQRILLFGLGSVRHIDALEISWPSGLDQSFRDLAVDREWTFVEGMESPWSGH